VFCKFLIKVGFKMYNKHKKGKEPIDMGKSKELTAVAYPAAVSYMDHVGYKLTPAQQKHWDDFKKADHEHELVPQVACTVGFLNSLIGAKRVIQFGAVHGFATHVIAHNLPEDGRVFALELKEDQIKKAEKYWSEGVVRTRIEVMTGDLIKSLEQLIAQGQAGTFDVVILSGEHKQQYPQAYELALELLRQRGSVIVTGTFLRGEVIDEEKLKKKDAAAVALRELNDNILTDKRVQIAALPCGDGMTFALKL